ncbi:alpha/beta-hydrolase [Hypoxylon trugodes]|uniref:alpha/beta-hydrolase n=1 Tax=Hypoxylon trugodes TaxID=326681 RepID=UPI00219A0AA1|nr:alpha/beta-hydrolase [Hypoxylon trugodes]KAI1393689.1 alpha/beta-hydrolase [Hypoxylon trugodes]
MAPDIKLDFYPAPHPNRTGVIILPGGGYGRLTMDREGTVPAQWLNDRDIDAWVLSYTIVDESHPSPIFPAPQQDALEAVKQIRASGRVDRLGIWGFSAGGHLAAVTATEPSAGLDFAILAYPVITMAGGAAHGNSRRRLLGDGCAAGSDLENSMSAEKRVNGNTPPTFLFHSSNDDNVLVQNPLDFAAAMAQHQRPFQLLILPDGPHGIGLALDYEHWDWSRELERWLKESIPKGSVN